MTRTIVLECVKFIVKHPSTSQQHFDQDVGHSEDIGLECDLAQRARGGMDVYLPIGDQRLGAVVLRHGPCRFPPKTFVETRVGGM